MQLFVISRKPPLSKMVIDVGIYTAEERAYVGFSCLNAAKMYSTRLFLNLMKFRYRTKPFSYLYPLESLQERWK